MFQGKAYHWRQTLDIVAGRDSTLDLTLANAETEPITAGTTSAGRRSQPTPRSCCSSGSTASSKCGLRLPTRRDSWLTRPDSL